MWKAILIAAGVAAAVTLTAGAVALGATSGPRSTASPATGAAEPNTVVITDDRFQPPVIRVEPGTTVTWVNQDDEAHNVAAADGSWQSPILQKGEQFTHTFSEGESARYFCTLHPWMTGVVLVGDQVAPPATPGAGQQNTWQNMWQYMQQMHDPEDIQAMRERMDAVFGAGSFDAMLEAMQNGQPCPFAGTDSNGSGGATGGGAGGYGPGGMMGGSTGGYGPGGMMGGSTGGNGPGGMMGGGTGGNGPGGMMGGGSGGMMGR